MYVHILGLKVETKVIADNLAYMQSNKKFL